MTDFALVLLFMFLFTVFKVFFSVTPENVFFFSELLISLSFGIYLLVRRHDSHKSRRRVFIAFLCWLIVINVAMAPMNEWYRRYIANRLIPVYPDAELVESVYFGGHGDNEPGVIFIYKSENAVSKFEQMRQFYTDQLSRGEGHYVVDDEFVPDADDKLNKNNRFIYFWSSCAWCPRISIITGSGNDDQVSVAAWFPVVGVPPLFTSR